MIVQKLKNLFHLFQSLFANFKYHFPAKELIIIGVTGTDGKTTTTSMIYHILRQNGLKVGMISTIFAKIGNEEIDTGMHVTTPEPWDLPKILRQMIEKEIQYVVIESTSSGLDQNRLFGIRFDASLITNIGHDHIDYHKTWENYANAKFKIIEKTKPNGLVVLNQNHESYKWLKTKYENRENKQRLNSKTNRIDFNTDVLKDTQYSIDGIQFSFKDVKFKVPIIGEYNFQNVLGAINICNKYLNLEEISNSIKTFKSPKGRMEVIQTKPFTIIIDFAHTPSALEKALESINKIRPNNTSKIITVFGCAGQRDPERRKMGYISLKYSDITILTIEDSRTEKLFDINSEIISHADNSGNLNQIIRFQNHKQFIEYKTALQQSKLSKGYLLSFDYEEVQNRIDAIELAMNIAKDNDIVFVTGKGHEESLAIGTPIVEYPYTDHETIKNLQNK